MSDTKRIIRADLDEIVEAVQDEFGAFFHTTERKDRLRTTLERFVVKLPSDEMIEDNGKDGGLRDGELQMFWEGAKWMRDYIFKTHVTIPKKGGEDEG